MTHPVGTTDTHLVERAAVNQPDRNSDGPAWITHDGVGLVPPNRVDNPLAEIDILVSNGCNARRRSMSETAAKARRLIEHMAPS